MIARKREQLSEAYVFPEKWCSELKKVFDQTYQQQCSSLNKAFEVFAFSFPDELLLCISLLDQQVELSAPVTYKASLDLTEAEQDQEKIMANLIDSAAIFFDSYFKSGDNEDTYCPVWSETEFLKQKFYYQVSRENIGLTLKADHLLNQ